MHNPVDLSGKPFHFIGIGGIGMSALAYVLAKRRLPVSGSDTRLSHITERLASLGAHIFSHQDAGNLRYFQSQSFSTTSKASADAASLADQPALATVVAMPSGENGLAASVLTTKNGSFGQSAVLPQVVCSTAISKVNREYRAAVDLGCSILHRSDLLAALMQDTQGIAIAGTHGKTTTSSLVGYLLLKAGLDPTIVIGGEVDAWGGNARLGEGNYLVAEADESDGSLAKLSAHIGVVTNIELDHPDYYSSLEEVVRIFQIFERQCHVLVGCIDCTTVRDRLNPTITYSLNPDTQADYWADQVCYGPMGTTARIWEQGQILGQIKVPLLGAHNLSNTLAAIAVARHLGIAFETLADALMTFKGARRRFEYRGEVNDIVLVDDYAHHPSEIQATLAAGRLAVNGSGSALDPVALRTDTVNLTRRANRLVAVFQPHRYTRTEKFIEEFGQSFGDADQVVITDVYSAGEANPHGLTGQVVADAISKHHSDVVYRATLPELAAFLSGNLWPGDLVVFLGAGNVNQVIPELLSCYRASA